MALIPLSELFAALADYLHTKTFHDLARHPERPAAFTRQRKRSIFARDLLTCATAAYMCLGILTYRPNWLRWRTRMSDWS